MTRGKMGFKRWIALGAVVFISLVLVAALYWRNDIIQASLDPKQPFQTYSPPPAPNYARAASWALIPDRPDRWTDRDLPADVFFVHPTTFDGGNHWNAPIDEPRADRLLSRVMLPNYAGPFYRVGRMFAPRYRQASLYSQLTNRDDAREARRFAYGDLRAAFRYYLDHYNFGRPFILVGVEQGGTLVARLLRDEVASQPRRVRQTAGVYMIDTVVPADDYGPAAVMPACSHRDQARCVVAWTSVLDSNPEPGQDRARRASVWSGEQLEDLAPRQPLCVNPLLGARSDDPAGVKSNLGAANVTGLEWGARPAFLIRQVGAQCVGGLLKVTRPKSPSLVPSGGWTDQLKQPAFSLFYADLEADAQARVASLLNLQDFPKPAPPIERPGDQGRTPAHKVGN